MTAQQPAPEHGDIGEVAPDVTNALQGLQDLDEIPVADHVVRFNAIHESLTAALSRIDEV